MSRTEAEAREAWPPDYAKVFEARRQRLEVIRSNLKAHACARAYYAAHPAEFIDHWISTYDPRNAAEQGLPAHLPLVMFERQREFVRFLDACLDAQANGLVEKSRDMGATWLSCAFAIWLWLFRDGASVGFGSNNQVKVDRIGDPDSIFEKLRLIIRNLPNEFLPPGFSFKQHAHFMKLINPVNGATITGEAGDNIGRGGRKLIMFKDEAAHYERPELIEAALADTTRVQIDISSVNGVGNVFHRRREAGVEWEPGQPVSTAATNVFIMDWSHHPAKDRAWYDARRKKAIDDGLLHIFAQEVDRDYAAAVEGVVIPPEWVRAAIDAHEKLGFDATGPATAGLDVADEGLDRNALIIARGCVVVAADEWGEVDTGRTARRAIDSVTPFAPLSLQYDCIGVGAGIKAEANRLREDAEVIWPKGLRMVPWNAGAGVLLPEKHVEPGDRDTPLNKDFYQNLKAQGWWQLRRRFERTYRAINEGVKFEPADLISLPSDMPKLWQLTKELSQATASKGARMKLVIDKTPPGTRSPNLADATVAAFWPADQGAYQAALDWV